MTYSLFVFYCGFALGGGVGGGADWGGRERERERNEMTQRLSGCASLQI